jgi:hypothetical protein
MATLYYRNARCRQETHREHIIYLPASRFWPVQGVESGIFLVLALALAIFTYWLVTAREA